MSAVLTLVTTVLIAYRIYSLSRHSIVTSTRKKKPFKNIVEIIIQSAAIYSTVVAGLRSLMGYNSSIKNFTRERDIGGLLSTIYANNFSSLQPYVLLSIHTMNTILTTHQAIGPTVMVSRITYLSINESVDQSTVQVSILHLHGYNTSTVPSQTAV